MTKGKYLDMLEQELTGLPRARIREIIVDIYGHFDEGEDAGLTEDEIAERLGEPRAVAAEYLQLYASEIERQPEAASAESRGFGLEKPYNMHEEFKLIEGDKLEVAMASVPVEVMGYDGPMLQVEFHGYRTSDFAGNFPSIQAEKKPGQMRVWQEQPQSQGFFDKLSGGFCRLRGQVTLHVPKIWLSEIFLHSASGSIVTREMSGKSIRVQAASGSVGAKSVCAQDSLLLQSASGAVQGEKCRAESIQFKAASGSVSASDITADGVMFSSASGSVRAERVNATGECECKSASSSVKLSSVTAASISAQSASGSVRLEAASSESMTLSSGSGSVRASLDTPANIEATSHSGSVELQLTGGFRFQAVSRSGSIDIEYPELQSTHYKRSASGVIGDGAKLVAAKAFSGHVTISPRQATRE